ncbi:DUF4105 domain-containing protein [Enterovibrio sp. ZSDZ35]|uniref:DUF4105 domain-containing protein n=1 Tax=Enterovibrio qingdaonensis TaxID=2899818 RepID=A0ABT5QGE0_9GAMM|nr:DUF4105 domain-containing protein [Enterovibrio sp. ZSDZ35]MDD1780022.1 DUF4105 domain-containing protein [Enterovibrio sp. ZSDZ35]
MLLHYEKGLVGEESLINDPSFFLSPKGRVSPEEELKATIQAFYQTPETQCKFPARKHWLNEQLQFPSLPNVDCSDYQNYLEAFGAQSISLVYASGYLGNPASMYGHVLLKFNNSENHEYLDNTFNYGARVPEDDNKLVYIFQGITGGYQGYYANQKYHHQNLTYSESELRDLWEYRLKLSEQDVTFVLAHLWELENASMTYYFFTENCAYQLAKLLELVIDAPLVAKNKLWVMPYDVIVMLNDANGGHYIDEVIYHGSRQEHLYNRYKQLDDDEKLSVQYITEQGIENIPAHLDSHDEVSAKKIIDTLYDYYAFVDVKNSGLMEEQTKKRKLLLTKRFLLPPGDIQWSDPEQSPPHHSQNTAMLQVSPLYNDAFGKGLELRFRANYYDMLNLNAARIPYSQLNTFDLRLLYEIDEDKWHFRELTLFDILNLNVSQTGLQEDKRYAWGVSAGYRPTSLDCADCSDAYVSGLIGKGWEFIGGFAGYAALTSELQVGSFKEANVLGGIEIGGVVTASPYWASSIKIGSQIYVNDSAEYKNYLVWEQRVFANRHVDFRTSVRYDEAFEYAANFSLYW